MSTLTQASEQWRSRPADQRFTSLTALHTAVSQHRINSAAKVVSNRSLEVQPIGETNPNGLQVVGPNGSPVAVSNWAFGQLAQRAGAPAGYLRELPAPLAADCLNVGLHLHRDVEELGVLLRREEGANTLVAATGPNYGRVWNQQVTGALIRQFGDGVTGDFRVPGVWGQKVEVTNENTTLYASDRDMFVFLADEDHRIEIPNRRDGQPGTLARGFFCWNSEVGGATLGIATFLLDKVCQNRIVWGAEGYSEIRIRHSSGAPDRFIEEVTPALQSYANSSASNVVEAVTNARKARVDNVSEFLARRFSRSQVGAIIAAHQNDEQRPIETVWDAVTGITAYARGIQYQNERVAIEREAGKYFAEAA